MIGNLLTWVRRLITSAETNLEYSGKSEMVRRYFFTNGFEGAMSMLGIVLGANLFAGTDHVTISYAGLGASLAMFISGFMGAYMTESAENRRRIRELNEAMLTDLKSSVVVSAGRAGAIIAGLLQGLGSLIFALTVLSPYLASHFIPFLTEHAFFSSIASGLAALFILGLLLGRLTRQGMLTTGLKMAGVGGVTAALLLLMDLLF